ncbi:hypothetical protein TWF696_003349 [Orbilia brochopaga]|uniref:Uncharacterized protein n=1 Tax=Orbilia brochopaga TaxID=3140254 RepID=A0AAV9TX99_9PEZI
MYKLYIHMQGKVDWKQNRYAHRHNGKSLGSEKSRYNVSRTPGGIPPLLNRRPAKTRHLIDATQHVTTTQQTRLTKIPTYICTFSTTNTLGRKSNAVKSPVV